MRDGTKRRNIIRSSFRKGSPKKYDKESVVAESLSETNRTANATSTEGHGQKTGNSKGIKRYLFGSNRCLVVLKSLKGGFNLVEYF